MLIHERNFPLKSLNTFGCDAAAETFIAFTEIEELQELIRAGKVRGNRLILSGGSNMLLLGDIPGIVVQPRLRGISFIDDEGEYVLVSAAAGENWHELVDATLAAGYSGLENLALIPGNVGAAPVQNIGAYGVELAERIRCVHAVDLDTGEMLRFDREACQFGYRESIFKQTHKDRMLITRVELELERAGTLRTTYGAIEAELAAHGISSPTARDVFDAVCRIRRSKLPDPAQLGNAGSFFKNPIVTEAEFRRLNGEFPGLVAYPLSDGRYKLAAGWLIEHAGLKGFRVGAVGVHEHQSLVLVNYGGARGEEILALAHEVQARVRGRFAVELTPEVRFVP